MAILNAMLSGGERRRNDFYPTPIEATNALIPFITHWKNSLVWECACGDGAISKVLITSGFNVISTDLYDYGYGESNCNFLSCEPRSSTIITNPPFNYSSYFIDKAISNKTERMALLLKSNYWHAAKRLKLFQRCQPKLILALTFRLDFTGAGAPHTDCSWVVWEGQCNTTEYVVVAKP